MPSGIQSIVLGPAIDLHLGIHGSLIAAPPRGYRYRVRRAQHIYLHERPQRRFSPIDHYHRGEFVDFGPGQSMVHSAWWPVLHRSRWLVDVDEIGYPVLVGRMALAARFRHRYQSSWTGAFARRIGRRIEATFDAFAHPSCRAVVFQTKHGVERALDSLDALGFGHLAATLLKKCYVVYPAAAPAPLVRVRRKWSTNDPLRIVFCGRDFTTKDGELALRVISRLMAESMRCEFVYIGSVPPSVRRRYRAVLDRIDFVESAPRRVVLERMADGHVLFHPSPSESVGMVLLEAAASAMAIVCSEGRDLAHLHELVPKGGVLSVNRDRGRRRDYETAFTHHLQHLIRNPPQARRMGWLNYRVARSGPISIERRDGVLEAIYEDAGGENRTRPLTLREIRHARGSVTSTMSETRLERLIASAQPDPWRLGLRVFF